MSAGCSNGEDLVEQIDFNLVFLYNHNDKERGVHTVVAIASAGKLSWG